jgi:hypothetical protein
MLRDVAVAKTEAVTCGETRASRVTKRKRDTPRAPPSSFALASALATAVAIAAVDADMQRGAERYARVNPFVFVLAMAATH